jgi:hypothetical protein
MSDVRVRVVGVPDVVDPAVEHLWALVGGGDNYDGGRCFYLLPSAHVGGGQVPGDALTPARDRMREAGFPDVSEADLLHACRTYQDARRRPAG